MDVLPEATTVKVVESLASVLARIFHGSSGRAAMKYPG
jgi:hypothetical protein